MRAVWKIPAAAVPSTNDVIRFRIDERDVFWADAVRAAAAWTHQFRPKAHVPADAYAPVYSSWYAHHTEIDAATVVREAEAAAKLGMKVFFLDARPHLPSRFPELTKRPSNTCASIPSPTAGATAPMRRTRSVASA